MGTPSSSFHTSSARALSRIRKCDSYDATKACARRQYFLQHVMKCPHKNNAPKIKEIVTALRYDRAEREGERLGG